MRYLTLLLLVLSCPVLAQTTDDSQMTHSLGALKYQTSSSAASKMIPDISAIGTMSAAIFRDDPVGDTGHDPARTGFSLQEIELSLQSVIDPYLRADVILSFHEDGVELEEGYVTTLALPKGLQLKAGKMLLPFGRHNSKHLEMWDFADTMLVNKYLIGVEPLSELGMELSYLFPLPFYLQAQASVTNGNNETSFNGPRKQDLLYQGRLSASFDLSDAVTLLIGGSGAFGHNDTLPGNKTQLYGGDLLLKWKPSSQKSFTWQSEFIYRKKEDLLSTNKDGGAYTYVDWQFAKRWHTGLRFDYVGIPSGEFQKEYRLSPAFTFNPTEFSRIRAQYNYSKQELTRPNHAAILELEFSMGPHGVHSF